MNTTQIRSRAFFVGSIFIATAAFLGLRGLVLDPLASRPINTSGVVECILLGFLGLELIRRNARARIAAIVLLTCYILRLFGLPNVFTFGLLQFHPLAVILPAVPLVLLCGETAKGEFHEAG